MGYHFTPIDFPDYADLTYKQLRPILMFQGKPPIGVFADVLRATLPRKKQREFDKMGLDELHTLIETYVDFNITREDVLDERREPGPDWGNSD